MNLYEYQRFMSFTDLGQRSLRFNIFKIIFLRNRLAWPSEAKFYVEPLWDGRTYNYVNGLSHITNIATMPIYGKNLKKFSETKSADDLNVGMRY